MELLPDGQELEGYLRTEPLSPTPAEPTTGSAWMTEPCHSPSDSHQTTPLITPHVLPRPPSNTTRQLHSQNTLASSAPVTDAEVLENGISRHSQPDATPASAAQEVASSSALQVIPATGRSQTPATRNDNRHAATHNKLNPSQQVFHRLAKLDPRALHFQGEDFFIMMDLWAESKWDSRKMAKNEWEEALQLFNERRQAKEPSPEHDTHTGQDISRQVSQGREDDISATCDCGTETFWQKHCYTVPGFEPQPLGSATSEGPATSSGTAGPSNAKGKGKVACNKDGAQRKLQACHRCSQEKYPGGEANRQINHKKSECSDGVSPSLRNIPLPLPLGVIKGKELKPNVFRQQCSRIQEKHKKEQPLSDEDQVFLRYYSENLIEGSDGAIFWPVGNLTVPPHSTIVQIGQSACIKLY
ncbi:hypothetical protein M407DRAFT_26932 [Tulasnella calospora MUT 4182]|uniref:Uncharacterized protein n=1 Tax=Tulasnella calospora MUT 4182 TaxID=1051891 RepID=A0A0C3LQD7_9AGAM|nr:hypothetical protein M407DRAFT_26932 [Tulasnella calospora MUT 4182]